MKDSRVTTIVVGVLTVAMGLLGVASGLGFLPHGPADPSIPPIQQRLIAICIGVVFAAGGFAAMLTTLPGRAALIIKNLLALIIVLGLTSLFGWVAVGPGSRGFSSPLAILGPRVNEVSGRIMFGLGGLLGLLILVIMVRTMVRPTRSPEA